MQKASVQHALVVICLELVNRVRKIYTKMFKIVLLESLIKLRCCISNVMCVKMIMALVHILCFAEVEQAHMILHHFSDMDPSVMYTCKGVFGSPF